MKRSRRLSLFIMFLLLPVTINYFSPYLIIEGLANKIISAAFFIWLVMFFSSLIIGRSFCAYICPYGGLQMVMDSVVQKPLKQVPFLRLVKKVLGILWLAPILILAIINSRSLRLDFFYLTETFISVDNAIKLIGYYVIVVSLSVLPLFLGKRATCHYLCPMSILNILGTKIANRLNIPSLRLNTDSTKCTGCKQCNKNCPMSLNVCELVKNNNIKNSECILCGECSNTCKFGAVHRTFGNGKGYSYAEKHSVNK